MTDTPEFRLGFLLGIFVSEGHFGGDGRQPQMTLRLHIRHEPLLRYLMAICPGGRLYGPYHHGDRHYFQLMFRGTALRDHVIPLLEEAAWEHIDPHSYERYSSMKERYHAFLTAGTTP